MKSHPLLLWWSEKKLGGKAYAFGEMMDRVAPLREFSAPFSDMPTGMIAREDCRGPFTHLRKQETAAEEYLLRLFLGIQQAPESSESGNDDWLRGTENPADGLAEVKSEMAP